MERFIEALARLQQSQEAKARCVAGCDYDASYWCSDQYHEVEEAEREVADAFRAAIDARLIELGVLAAPAEGTDAA